MGNEQAFKRFVLAQFLARKLMLRVLLLFNVVAFIVLGATIFLGVQAGIAWYLGTATPMLHQRHTGNLEHGPKIIINQPYNVLKINEIK